MARPYSTNYYFNRTRDLRGFEHISTNGEVVLDHLCGATIADAFCNDSCDLQLVRFSRSGETLTILRRLTDIKATVTIYK